MIIIPARLQSTRFPRKILCDINGYPMVIATANRVKNIDDVVIATDSDEVMSICEKYGFKAILTSSNHQSGTDRINEAAEILKLKEEEIIINVQADEPFIEPEVVEAVKKKITSDKQALMASCYKKIQKDFANDSNHVKVIVDINGYAIYFSRSKIPYDREEHKDYLGHLGIYGFRCKNLKKFCSLPSSPLEQIEKLEQLRAIYNGEKIAMVEVKSESFGIDTREDLELALKIFRD
ncbi:MAG: 3-deoxy-manno-octulosonate cytidylyltransferase [Proteobacteria bacterium]|nr:MAG: 3-deoxy-manno-octulosonate cytidylyltransferase [Pseudomonadota bacterium]